jgi:hypothetical protein
MKKGFILSMVAAGALALVGCGGSSDPVETATAVATDNLDSLAADITGVFKDTNVAGLTYTCSSGKKDVTNDNGEYTCTVGDSVTFSIGGYVLGRPVPAASGVVTPSTLYPNSLEAATNVAQLLQTFDDGSDGTITIPANFTGLDDISIDPTDPNFDDVLEKELADEGFTAWVSEAAAQEHMLRTLLSGLTLYTSIYDEMGTMESWSFNDDMTMSSWVEIVGGNDYGTESIDNIDGMTMTLTCASDSDGSCEEGSVTIEVKQILPDYLIVEVSGGDIGSETEILRLYFDETKARAYLLALTAQQLKVILAGNTLYTSIYEEMGTLESWAFSADLTSVTWTELVGGSESEAGTLSIEGMVMTSTDSDGTATVTVNAIGEEYLDITIGFTEDGVSVTQNGRLYYDETTARAYFLL